MVKAYGVGVGVLLAMGAVCAAGAPALADDGDFGIRDARITESSGLAASARHPGVYWTHNDSEDGPYVYAVDSRTGKTVATVTLTGIGRPRDVEAVSMGPGGQLYVGDIGDNTGGSWSHVWIYRFPEPKVLKDVTLRAVQYDVTYADGPRDAEALMVHPKTGRAYIASKKEGGGALYAGPEKLTAGRTNVFRRIAPIDLWVTDGAFSPDGRRLALRSYLGGRLYRWEKGRPVEDGRLSVPLQRQGESMTYTTDGRALMYGTEGAGSEVTRVAVEGGGTDPAGTPKAPGDPAAGAAGTDGADGTGPASENRDLFVVVLVVAGATAAFTLLRRALRRA
ncbi:WD40 repeat domain-containing protein [Streptomyces polyrhachis]|uniref:WD40 repeat domain-containing protein n=1 Tax=Streptomyces polyrhachis TaxID=1282885 RepID=A0ABW2GJ57_9ACTN